MRRMTPFLGLLGAALVVPSAFAQPLRPDVASTIRKFPEMGIFEPIGPGDRVQSTYSRTTAENREFRRAFAEFTIPTGEIESGTLVLAETRGWTAYPMPPDVHHVTAYAPADLAVTTDDWDRPAVEVGTLQTDANEDTRTFMLDVSELVDKAKGGTIGFRVQLAADPGQSDYLPLGSEFAVTLGVVTKGTVGVWFDFAEGPFAMFDDHAVLAGLEPPPPFTAADFDIGSIRLNGTVPVDGAVPVRFEDYEGNGLLNLIVGFDPVAVAAILPPGEHVPVTVTGTLGGGEFSGTDFITAAGDPPPPPPPPPAADPPLAARVVASGGRLRVDLSLPGAEPARLELIDVLGRLRVSRQVESLGPGSHTLDLSHDPAITPGIYFLRLTQGDEEARTRVAVLP